LKELGLDWKQILALRSRFKSEKFTGVFKSINKMFLILDADQSEMPIVLDEIVLKAPNLIEMCIQIPNCNNSEVFLAQNPKIGEDGVLVQLQILEIIQVSAIMSILSENSSWLNPICEKVHELNVLKCPDVEALGVHSTMSFSFLKKLLVSDCPQLQYLFTTSVAKKLVNLEEITVLKCESLKEIVAKEGDEEEPKVKGEDKYENEIIFMKLEKLMLGLLGKLESFYTGSCTLNFPSLRNVVVIQCLNTKILRHCDKVPPKFRVVIDRIHCKGDKKALITQQFEEGAS